MLGNKKGNVVIAALIIAAAMCVCTAGLLYGMKKVQHNAFRFAESQKNDIISRLRDQKNELKRFTWNREARLRDFVRKEMKGAKLEVKASAGN